MRRFLVATRNDGTGVHESERNSNLEEPRNDEVSNLVLDMSAKIPVRGSFKA
jgi:hypothetical protein